MKILVTGSNGFIGSNVCRWFKKHTDYSVYGLGRKAESATVVDQYVCCDLDSDSDVNDKLIPILQHNIDAVIHLAADMRREPHNIQVVESNCTGTQRLLEACEKSSVSIYLQLSSLPVIGYPTQHPITEEHPLRPPTVYHATKIAEEFLAGYADYARGIRTASFRICAPIGIGVKESTIFPTFARQAVSGKDLVVYGRGTRQQTFVHVDDIAQALFKSIQAPTVRGVYNLASNNLISNFELAELCIKVAGSKSTIKFSDKPDPEEGRVWDVSFEKLKRDCGYSPEIGIESCVEEQVQHYRSIAR